MGQTGRAVRVRSGQLAQAACRNWSASRARTSTRAGWCRRGRAPVGALHWVEDERVALHAPQRLASRVRGEPAGAGGRGRGWAHAWRRSQGPWQRDCAGAHAAAGGRLGAPRRRRRGALQPHDHSHPAASGRGRLHCKPLTNPPAPLPAPQQSTLQLTSCWGSRRRGCRAPGCGCGRARRRGVPPQRLLVTPHPHVQQSVTVQRLHHRRTITCDANANAAGCHGCPTPALWQPDACWAQLPTQARMPASQPASQPAARPTCAGRG